MKLINFFLVVIFISLFLSCFNEVDIGVTEFVIDGDYNVSVVADDSLLDSPVAMKEDNEGNFWIVEMPGYMRDIDGNDQDIADGRIVLLKDRNGDGVMDARKIILDSLLNPRAIELVYNGFLYTDGNSLKFIEYDNINEDVGRITIVDSIYVVGGNIEHQPNGLLYGLDNWIYSAKSNVRYRRLNSEWLREVTSFRGQWGISQDEYGRLIYNHNSAPIIGDVAMPNYFLINPYQKLDALIGNYYTDDMRLYPIQAISVNRGYQKGVLDSNDVLINYTSACSPIVYYGQSLDKFYGNIFVCAPEANLISRYTIDHVLQIADKPVDKEFMITKDESFRPVALNTGFDGALYILDMHKGIIQHSAYMTSYLRKHILNKGLDKINGQGRIFKVEQSENYNHREIKLTNKPSDWLLWLSHKNMNVRLWAQKQLVHSKSMHDDLVGMVLQNNNEYEFRHALWVLEGQDQIDDSLLLNIDYSEISNSQFVSIAPIIRKSFKKWDKKEQNALLSILLERQGNYIFDVLISPFFTSENFEQWLKMAQKYPNDLKIIEALISSVDDEAFYLNRIEEYGELNMLRQKLIDINSFRVNNKIQQPQLPTKTFDDNRTKGLKLFKTYCASCHGFDGLGLKNTAPSLADSDVIQNEIKQLARIILNGYDSGNDSYQIMMPKYIDDPSLDDNDIADLVSYISSTFSVKGGGVSSSDVKLLRSQLKLEN